MKWPRSSASMPPPPRPEDYMGPERRSASIGISDPAFAEFFNIGTPNFSGVTVTESSALGVSALFRAVSLIAQTIASLKVGAIIHHDDGTREQVDSWLDDPCPTLGLTAFEFWELIIQHLLLHGNAFLVHIKDGAGRMVGVIPIHPLCVSVEWDPEALMKVYKVVSDGGQTLEYTDLELTHVLGMSSDGLRGYSLISTARNSLGVTIAGDRAAASNFSNGAMVSGLVTPEEDITPEEAEEIARSLQAHISGYDNAGKIALLSRQFKFTQMSMSMADAQFLESRRFQVEEVSRWTGVPPHLLMQTEKQTSWGTGVAEQNRGLARTVLGPIAKRLEGRLSRLLPANRYLEFDFTALEKSTPEEEIELLLRQVAGGLMTVNEARAIRNMPPVPDGDILYQPAGSVGSTEETPEGADSPRGEPAPTPSPRGEGMEVQI